jgi:hypothetical protein
MSSPSAFFDFPNLVEGSIADVILLFASLLSPPPDG